MDIKYLVDGANFVISKMHFNPENNYYITLGVPQNAGPEDIRNRWKRLMLLYHPDRREGGNEWVSERAKKVNEAYTELKDNSKRAAFDRKLAEQAVRPAAHTQARTIPAPKRSRSIIPHENTRWEKSKKYLPKALIVSYLAAAAIFIAFIYYENNSSSLEQEFLPKYSPTSQVSQKTAEGQLKTSEEEKNIQEPLKTDKKTFQADTQRPPASPSYNMQEKSSYVQPKNEKRHSSTAISQKQTPDHHIPPPAVLSMNSYLKKEEVPPKLSEERYKPPEQQNVQPHTENQRTVTQAMVQEAKAGPVYTMSSQEITKDEVEVFIQRYITAYRENDLRAFMSLFSRSAVENSTAYYNDIQKAYKETFSKEINYYIVKDLNIIIDGRHALVTGVYHANRYLASDERWVKLNGNIQWNLAKENNILKIMSINYDK